jgi:hypothetical protein
MNKLLSIKIETVPDETPDFSLLGQYTDRNDDWAICVHCGRYIRDAESYDRVVDRIEGAQYGAGYEMDEMYEAYETGEEEGVDYDRHDRLEAIYDAMELARERLEKRTHDCAHNRKRYNYFVPYANAAQPGSAEYRERGLKDFERAEAHGRGDWSYIGVIAVAEIDVLGTVRRVASAGCWGTESDSDYGWAVAYELGSLKRQLGVMNADLSNWEEMIDGL